MWALRRASNLQKLPGLLGFALKLGVPYSAIRDPQPLANISNRPFLETLTKSTSIANPLSRSFSSQASSKIGDSDDDKEDLFAELNIPLNTPAREDEECYAEAGHLDLEEPSLSKSVDEEQKPRRYSELYSVIKSSRDQQPLLQWVANGKELDRNDIEFTFKRLIMRGNHAKALHLSKFLETCEGFTFTLPDYIRQLNLIGKVKGIEKAHQYIKKVPPQFQTEPLYRTLLAQCVASSNLKKSDQVFNEMKDLEFPPSTFALNQLLLLYSKLEKKKIADVLLLMEKSKLRPDMFTFRILVSVKGSAKDIPGMEQVIETMKNLGVEPDAIGRAVVAGHYISAGLHDKAVSLMRDIEGETVDLKEKRAVLHRLIALYANLGKSDEVTRVWRICESNPRPEDYVESIKAYGKLKNVEEAEKIFKTMSSKWKNLHSIQYCALLRAYVDNGCSDKAKKLVETMKKEGVPLKADIVNLVVWLHVEAGQVDVADSFLAGAVRDGFRPKFRSFMSVMNAYAVRGDIPNVENIFKRMRECGYVGRAKLFSTLLLAYVNAKTPAYGIKDRMKADNAFPDEEMAAHIADLDSFSNSTPSTLDDVGL